MTRKVDISLPGNGNSNSHGARPVHQIVNLTQAAESYARFLDETARSSISPPARGLRKDHARVLSLSLSLFLSVSRKQKSVSERERESER